MYRRWLWLVLALTLLTGALRSVGRDYLLPYGPEPDGLVYEKQVRTLEDGRSEARGQHLFGFYPLLPAALTATLTDAPHADDVPRPLDEQLARAAAQRARIRLVIAWLSALAVPFVWLLARRFVPEAWAFAAAALCAVDPFVLWFAQQARPHAALLPWVAAGGTPAASLRVLRKSKFQLIDASDGEAIAPRWFALNRDVLEPCKK
jgi:hypothetical protein